MKKTCPRVTVECEPEAGHLSLYASRSEGNKVAKTEAVAPGVNVDLDRSGRILGIEIIKTFAPGSSLRRILDLATIRRAVEKRFQTQLADLFDEIRHALDEHDLHLTHA